jgi:hypothetical protein
LTEGTDSFLPGAPLCCLRKWDQDHIWGRRLPSEVSGLQHFHKIVSPATFRPTECLIGHASYLPRAVGHLGSRGGMLMICGKYREPDKRDGIGRHGTRSNAGFDLKAVRTGIGAALRTVHSDVLREEVPDGMAELLKQLDQQRDADSI